MFFYDAFYYWDYTDFLNCVLSNNHTFFNFIFSDAQGMVSNWYQRKMTSKLYVKYDVWCCKRVGEKIFYTSVSFWNLNASLLIHRRIYTRAKHAKAQRGVPRKTNLFLRFENHNACI